MADFVNRDKQMIWDTLLSNIENPLRSGRDYGESEGGKRTAAKGMERRRLSFMSKR